MDQDNKNYILSKLKSFKVIVSIATILIFISVIVLVYNTINNTNYKKNTEYQYLLTNKLIETKDENIIKFVNDYFVARNNLDFVNIYKSFNKDYFSLKDTKEGKKYDSGILYERNYVKGFDNIKIYELDNIDYKDKIIFITFDMKFYLSNVNVPSIMIAYIVKDEDNLYFKDNFNVGESKYIESLMANHNVVELYNNIKNELEKKLLYDNNLKLVYNSVRQYNINFTTDILSEKDKMVNKFDGKNNFTEKELIDLARKKEEKDEKK